MTMYVNILLLLKIYRSLVYNDNFHTELTCLNVKDYYFNRFLVSSATFKSCFFKCLTVNPSQPIINYLQIEKCVNCILVGIKIKSFHYYYCYHYYHRVAFGGVEEDDQYDDVCGISANGFSSEIVSLSSNSATNGKNLTNIISYHVRSYHIISYYIIYHIISYHIISYHIISYHISYHIISYQSYHIISYHINHIISYHIISYHIISYHIISYHIISYHISFIISYIVSYN